MNNSSAVFLSNVDDYLAPSQACVNPLYNSNSEDTNNQDTPATTNNNKNNNVIHPTTETNNQVIPRQRKRRTRISPTTVNSGEEQGGPVIPTTEMLKNKKDPIKASMADCLACSGCVTTAETVLLEQQHSLTALKKAMHENNSQKLVVATVSPAVWADLLRHLQVPPHDAIRIKLQLVTCLREILQVAAVLDGNLPLQWSLLQAGEEFCRAHQQAQIQQQQQQTQAQPQAGNFRHQLELQNTPSIAVNYQETKFMLPDGSTHVIPNNTPASPPSLPLLTSSCPALVCLVEKSTHGAVRHLAHSKSPMSLAGAWWRKQQQQQQELFHLAFMPCHDKKLEASRKDFARPTLLGTSEDQQDVDLVLTTQEWFQMLAEFAYDKASSNNAIMKPVEEYTQEELRTLVKSYLETLEPAPMHALQLNNNTLALPEPIQRQGTLLAAQEDVAAASPHSIMTTSDMEIDQNHDDDDDTTGNNNAQMDIDDSGGVVTNNNGHNSNSTSPENASFFTMGSGGLAEFVFRYAAWRLFQTDLSDTEIVWKPVPTATNTSGKVVSARVRRAAARNRDYYQASLYRHDDGYSCEEAPGAVPVLRFAIAYGLQTLQRVLEPFAKKSDGYPFDFVEAMACPSGCLNGGGQVRVADRETPTQTRQRVAATRDLFVSPSSSSSSTTLQELERTFGPGELQTNFHVVPPLQHSLGAAAGVAVKDTQW
ncbi:Probable cytosolic Fe-S cluster assembly factor [Seminavis robusta]|uniref:Probable cytosolic Fe-S cluster assembly factor n=1 Tax=Seminavis robusta TaxID=568900 RepID=A0A9N8HBB6_9STRA|nr:Probable cytosolic Fe-S cluster assembly factor [Seminavis robusta]|eukprot:Sro271_g104510.1 Probable cytosolic Fe-S cluster assembly factor (707) ;mRNA; r:26880-29000